DLTLSELMVGGPIDAGDMLQPTIGYEVSFGTVHGYVEAYGEKTAELSVEYEIATDATSPALVDVDVQPRPARDGRGILSRAVPGARRAVDESRVRCRNLDDGRGRLPEGRGRVQEGDPARGRQHGRARVPGRGIRRRRSRHRSRRCVADRARRRHRLFADLRL